MSTATTEKKMYTLKGFDGGSFEVDESVAMMCGRIKKKIESRSKKKCSNNTILFKDVSADYLGMAIDYCRKHVESKKAAADHISGGGGKLDDLKEWDEAFVDVDQETLFGLIVAAFELNIEDLLYLAYDKAKCRNN